MSEKADVKTSRMQKGRKTINYLQKMKDKGTPPCPDVPRSPGSVLDHGSGNGRCGYLPPDRTR